MDSSPRPRSLVLATDIDVLPLDATVSRRDDHLVVRTPGNPTFWWGNFLVFDDAPRAGDGERWEAAFDAAFADQPATRHRAMTWDRDDGEEGAIRDEFIDRGYRAERTIGLRAAAHELRPHPRASAAVAVRTLDPRADESLWEAEIAIRVADHDPASDPPLAEHEEFLRRRQRERRELLDAGRGAWYVALDPDDGGVLLGSCGVIATGPRGRYQDVHVAGGHRGRGIASRLVAEAGGDAARRHGLRTLVIAADADYHALGIYESLGFRRADRLCGVASGDPAPAVAS